MEGKVIEGNRLCQRCGERFDLYPGSGKAKYCSVCRDLVMAERHRGINRKRRVRARQKV